MFTLKYDLISRIPTCIQKVCKKVQIFTQKYELISRILTCIQKVCKKSRFSRFYMTLYQEFKLVFKRYAKKSSFDAKIWPYIKNSNLHSKGMQKVQIFTLLYDLISRIQTCIQKVCKKVQFWRKNMTLYQEF